jgi:Mn2+/Fe2+ NRAMP family transporter
MSKRPKLLLLVGPGLLVAATGVGAGDLATAAFTGDQLGTAVLWAVVAGAVLKLFLTEGLARWQLATGTTLLEGALTRTPRPLRWLFLLYLLPFSWFVGSALMSACGVTALALLPLEVDPERGKILLGMAHGLLGLVLVLFGGFRLFERVMSACIGLMFATVVVTAVLLRPDWSALARGLVIPRIPDADGQGLTWTVALLGGVGGTLTVLCYGYWIREKGRTSAEDLPWCRLDLSVGYAVTAVFGLAMVVIGSSIEIEGSGAGLIAAIAARLEEPLGPAGRWIFLAGAWGAVFSSLLGVWQAVPYIFADFWRVATDQQGEVDTRARPYRAYLFALAIVPMPGLFVGFRAAQKAYALVGAAFLPLLAIALLILNGRSSWVGARMRNGPLTVAVLALAVILFVAAGVLAQ